jgi:hypothetical protein
MSSNNIKCNTTLNAKNSVVLEIEDELSALPNSNETDFLDLEIDFLELATDFCCRQLVGLLLQINEGLIPKRHRHHLVTYE